MPTVLLVGVAESGLASLNNLVSCQCHSPFLSSKLSERSFVGVKRLLTELLMPEKSMYFAGCLAFLLGLSPSKACPSSETCPVDPAECELRIAEGAKC